MRALIVSDIHLGSPYFRVGAFEEFLDRLPPGAMLVLNGDTMDGHRHPLPPAHRAVLERLKRESFARRVIWVAGNHDDDYRAEGEHRIEFVPNFAIPGRLFAAHGFDFDNVMPRHRLFIRLFRLMHAVRVWLGAEGVHVAYYAKKWKFLYAFLIRRVMANAVEFAKENGYPYVVCGHTHCVDDRVVEGIHYLNTGSWTEDPLCYIDVDDESIVLHRGAAGRRV